MISRERTREFGDRWWIFNEYEIVKGLLPFHYTEMGIECDESKENITRKYRQLSLKYHPDRPGGDQNKFVKIDNAYKCLSDLNLRKSYDEKILIMKKILPICKVLTLTYMAVKISLKSLFYYGCTYGLSFIFPFKLSITMVGGYIITDTYIKYKKIENI